jgi:hypothetical protein
MAKLDVTAAEAAARLAESGGRIADLLGEPA